MKIVFLGNFNVEFSSENHHKKSLEALGHEVVTFQEGVAKAEQIYKQAYNADLFIWVHTHGWKTRGNGTSMKDVLFRLKQRRVPTVTYHLDLWLGLNREKDLHVDPVYKDIEYFFTVDKEMADWFNKNTRVKGRYLPAGVFHEEAYAFQPSAEMNDVIFVGSKGYHPEWPYRPLLLDTLSSMYGDRFKHYGGDGLGIVRGAELNQLYANTKVVVGDTLCIGFDYPYYWSDRVYETLGRGGFIIHPYIKGMEEQFEDKKHLVFYEYNNFDDLKEKIDYYLEHDEEREVIRKAGHELVRNNYTYKNRWDQIIKELRNDNRLAG